MLELAHPTQRVFRHHGTYMNVNVPDSTRSDKMLWIPSVHRTVSTEGTGIPDVAESIAKHLAYLRQSGDWAARERARLEVELETLIRAALMSRFREEVPPKRYDEILERVIRRNLSPWEAVNTLLDHHRESKRSK
jgi:LAO/AO transport system kinase